MQQAVRISILSVVLAVVSLFGFACTVSPWEKTAEEIAATALPIAASIFDVADPSAAQFANSIEGGAQTLLAALQAAQKDPTATNLAATTAAVNSLQSNIDALLAAMQIKDPKGLNLDTQLADLFAQAVDEIAAIIEANASTAIASLYIPPSSVRVIRNGRAKGWTARQIKKHYNKLAKKNPRLKRLK